MLVFVRVLTQNQDKLTYNEKRFAKRFAQVRNLDVYDGGFSAIATGEGGAAQGLQYLNTYSDYNNRDHALGRVIEANVFQEQVISAGDLGTSQFGPGGQTRTMAFFKVLDPSANYALVAFPTLETTSASTTDWASGALNITIDNAWSGHILQFGFLSTATLDQPSGVFYDNINFQAVPEPATLSVLAVSVAGMALRRRRK